ncbi:MAG: hypothetical protein DRH26_02235 [Deltaproteobacteria bacterium]|nr:MAG: hypothetical protein DRH26_02235 [Deltaproteobacteria bacterium]
MVHLTEAEGNALLIQQANKINPPAVLDTGEVADEGPESLLQGKIVKYCQEHGLPCQCFRQSRKARGFLVPGWPD